MRLMLSFFLSWAFLVIVHAQQHHLECIRSFSLRLEQNMPVSKAIRDPCLTAYGLPPGFLWEVARDYQTLWNACQTIAQCHYRARVVFYDVFLQQRFAPLLDTWLHRYVLYDEKTVRLTEGYFRVRDLPTMQCLSACRGRILSYDEAYLNVECCFVVS